METKHKFKRSQFPHMMAGSANYSGNFKSEMITGLHTPVTSTVWSQVTPVSMPWGNAYQNFPQVVRFTGSDCKSTFPFGSPVDRTRLENENKIKAWFTKRKGFFENEVVPPSKLRITEEHMASQLESMHISNMYTSHSSLEDSSTCTSSENNVITELHEDNSSDKEISMGESTSRMPSLVLCDELRQLQTPNILPPSLVAKLDSPSKALVLWKPPGPILHSTSCGRGINAEKQLQDITNNNNTNNNNNNNNGDFELSESESSQEIEDSVRSHVGRDLTPCSVISGLGSFQNSSDDLEDMSVDI